MDPLHEPDDSAELLGYFSESPPPGWRHRVTGRIEWTPPPDLLRFGRYVRRARYFARLTQDELGSQARVSQSMISRLERAEAPAMTTDRLVRVGNQLGHHLPLGFCPHTHACPWQPIVDLPARAPAEKHLDEGISPRLRAIFEEMSKS